ncbi:hypothetical protein ACVHMO_005437, partial [Escherichia coli]
EVNMVRRELQRVSGNSVNCMCWASLAALAFDAEERVERQKGNNENIATYAFRAACTVSRCLSRNVSGGIPRSYPEWKAILFPRDGADIFPDGWLENMTRRAERVFTSAKRQCGMLSASQAALFSQQTRQCASEQCTGRIQASCHHSGSHPDVSVYTERCAQGMSLSPVHSARQCPVQPTDSAETE